MICRVCGHALFAEPLLRFDNMPAIAQFLPGKEDLARDRGVDLRVCQCAGCGLVQLDSPPVPYYREVIRAAGFSEEMKAFRRAQFSDWSARHGLRGRKVIEIGCGRGEYLSLLAELDLQAFGLEHAESAVAACRASGLNVSKGFIDDSGMRLPDAPFDGFLMLAFLEHLPEPNVVLRGIAGNLDTGGVGLVEVPNFDMILREQLFSEFMTDHLFYFTQETLARTLEMNGLEVLEVRPVWHDYILSASVRKRARLDAAGFAAREARIRSDVDAYLRRHGERKVAIWGAGHQAFAVMSMMGLGGRVRYVVDSAPFKQGRFTPVSHLPIVAPGALKRDPVSAVIVMAGSYSDEVAAIIRREHGGAIAVAILRDHGLEIPAA
jgi:SAM-dependent methyltransferase